MPLDNMLPEATSLLQGANENQLKNNQLKQDALNSGFNYLKDASGKAIDFASQVNQDKARLTQQNMIEEGAMARQKAQATTDQENIQKKADVDKAKADYENFMTITPDLADSALKSVGLDLRKSIGQRMNNRAFAVMISGAAHIKASKINANKPSKNADPKKNELAGIKAFTKQYEGIQKQYSGIELQMKQSLASRNPTIKKQVDDNLKYLAQNADKYKQASAKTSEMGGLSDTPETSDDSTPPPTSGSDEDALIDKAFN